jgi:type IV secretion system protein VirB10
MERWRRSNDGSTLTIKRTVVRNTGETESVLVYENALSGFPAQTRRVERPAAVQLLTRTTPQAPDSPQQQEYVVTAGTRVLLRLTNDVNTKRTAPGDRIYLETTVPVFVNGRLVIPVGSYVSGTITESKRAGRVKGTSKLSLEFDSLTLRNGVARDLRSRPGSVDAKGNLDRSEGRMRGESNKGGDAGTVAQTTAAGTGIGAIAGSASGHTGMGAGIGAAAGAAGGLARVLGSRGADVVLHQGTTMEMVVNRDLSFTAEELRARNQ